MKNKPYYAIYKPLPRDSAGAAIQFSYDATKQSVFVDMAPQKGPKLEIGDVNQFDWKEKKIVMKLSEVDLSNLLLVLRRQKEEVKLFHTNADKTKTSILTFKKQSGDKYDNYALSISKADKTKPEEKQFINIFIDHHEAIVLEIFFRKGLELCLGF